MLSSIRISLLTSPVINCSRKVGTQRIFHLGPKGTPIDKRDCTGQQDQEMDKHTSIISQLGSLRWFRPEAPPQSSELSLCTFFCCSWSPPAASNHFSSSWSLPSSFLESSTSLSLSYHFLSPVFLSLYPHTALLNYFAPVLLMLLSFSAFFP